MVSPRVVIDNGIARPHCDWPVVLKESAFEGGLDMDYGSIALKCFGPIEGMMHLASFGSLLKMTAIAGMRKRALGAMES